MYQKYSHMVHRIGKKLHSHKVRNYFTCKTALTLTALVLLAGCFGPPEMKSTHEDLQKFERITTSIDSLKISYIKGGEAGGYPVILVHGTPGDAATWGDLLINPLPGFEYISMDRLGFGESDPESAVTDLSLHAKSLLPIAKSFGDKKPILLGHSYGGPVVVQAAIDYPDAFAGIIVAAGALDPNLEEVHFLQVIGDIWPISTFLPRMIRNANHELLSLKEDLVALEPRLKNLRVPTVIVHGVQDDLVPIENVPFMEKNIRKEYLVGSIIMEDKNHFLQMNSIKELNQSIQILAKHLRIEN